MNHAESINREYQQQICLKIVEIIGQVGEVIDTGGYAHRFAAHTGVAPLRLPVRGPRRRPHEARLASRPGKSMPRSGFDAKTGRQGVTLTGEGFDLVTPRQQLSAQIFREIM